MQHKMVAGAMEVAMEEAVLVEMTVGVAMAEAMRVEVAMAVVVWGTGVEEGKALEEVTVQQVGVMVEMEGDMALFVYNSKPGPYCMKNNHNSTKKMSS